MKIAVINNMNNNAFSLVRYLRDLGFDADLLLIDEEVNHFSPTNDCFDNSFLEYTKQLTWGGIKKYYLTSSNKIKKNLVGYDFIICWGLIPAYLEKAGIKADVFIPYGYDAYNLPFLFKNFKINLKSFFFEIYKLFIFKKQRKGIIKSKLIMIQNKSYKNILKSFAPDNKYYDGFSPLIYINEYNEIKIRRYLNNSILRNKYNIEKQNLDLVIFHHGRILWKNLPDIYSYKGTDIFLEGLKLLKEKNNIKFKVVFYEYGNDVEVTKLYLKENNLEENIIWLPITSRKNIMIEMYYSDVVVSQLHFTPFITGVNFEALTMGKIILQHVNIEDLKPKYDEIYPYLEAGTAEEVCNQLENYTKNKEYFKAQGLEAREWFKEHLINEPLNKIVELINEKQSRIGTTK